MNNVNDACHISLADIAEAALIALTIGSAL
jgi:hypothetical protein